MVRNLVRLFEQAPIYRPASAPIRWRRQGDPFSYEPAPLNRASRLLPPGKGRGQVYVRRRPRRLPGHEPAPCACAGFRVAPRPDAPAVRRRWSSGCSRQAASHLPCGKGVAARSGRQAALVRRAPLVASSRLGASRGSSGAEHVLGKDGVGGSIPLHGTIRPHRRAEALRGT